MLVIEPEDSVPQIIHQWTSLSRTELSIRGNKEPMSIRYSFQQEKLNGCHYMNCYSIVRHILICHSSTLRAAPVLQSNWTSRVWWPGYDSEAAVQNRFQGTHNNNKVHKQMQHFIHLPLRPLYLLTLWDPLSCLTVRTTNSTRFAFSFWHHESNLTMCSVRFMWPTIRFSTTLEVALGYYSSQSITSHSACSINSEEKATN